MRRRSLPADDAQRVSAEPDPGSEEAAVRAWLRVAEAHDDRVAGL